MFCVAQCVPLIYSVHYNFVNKFLVLFSLSVPSLYQGYLCSIKQQSLLSFLILGSNWPLL